MKDRVAVFLAGLLVGVLVFALAPAQAHHGDDLRLLKTRVSSLERRANSLEAKVKVLQDKTQAMDRRGFYLGPVGGNQVISVCPAGSGAIWEPTDVEGITRIDDCFESQSQRLRAKVSLP